VLKNLRDSKLYAFFNRLVAEENVETGQKVLPSQSVIKLICTTKVKVKISSFGFKIKPQRLPVLPVGRHGGRQGGDIT